MSGMPTEEAVDRAFGELQAIATLIRRPPRDDVELEADVADRLATAIETATADRARLNARVEALQGVARELRDRLLAFVGAVAEITDCSADVDAIGCANALLDRAALTGEHGGEADGR